MQLEMHQNDASREVSKLSIEDFFYHKVFRKINDFIAHGRIKKSIRKYWIQYLPILFFHTGVCNEIVDFSKHIIIKKIGKL